MLSRGADSACASGVDTRQTLLQPVPAASWRLDDARSQRDLNAGVPSVPGGIAPRPHTRGGPGRGNFFHFKDTSLGLPQK